MIDNAMFVMTNSAISIGVPGDKCIHVDVLGH